MGLEEVRVFRSCLIAVLLLGFASSASSHNPHDPIDVLGVSSSFAEDQMVFIAQLGASNVRTQEPLISRDGGWTWVGTPSGMDNLSEFSSVAVSPGFSEDGVVFFTTVGDGVFLSEDGAGTWTRVNDGLLSLEIVTSGIGLDASDEVVLFVANLGGGLVRTTDRGQTWIPSIGTENTIVDIAVSPDFATDATVYAANNVGNLASSDDGGTVWILRGAVSPGDAIEDIAIPPGHGTSGEVFVAAGTGVFRSEDFGASFELAADLDGTTVTAVAASPEYESDATLFALTAENGTYKSTDGGDSWTLNDIGTSLTVQTDIHFRELVVSDTFSTDSTVFVGAFEGLFRSDDGGVTWLEVETRPRSLISGLAVAPRLNPDVTVVASTYGGGAYFSADTGDTWDVANTGLGSSSLYDVEFSSGADVLPPVAYVSYRNFVAQSQTSSGPWNRLRIAGVSETSIFPAKLAVSPDFDNDQLVMTGTRGDSLVGSVDGGQTWLNSSLPTNTSLAVISRRFEVDRTAFAGTRTGRVFRSVDGGATWAPTDADLPTTARDVWVDLSPTFDVDGTVAAGTSVGLFLSSDGGDTWTVAAGGTEVSTGVIEHVKFSPAFDSDGTLLVSVRGVGLFRSDDGGNSWSSVGSALFADGNQLLEFEFSPDFANDGTVFGTAFGSLFRSTDRGDTWVPSEIDFIRYEESRQSREATPVDFSSGWVYVEAEDASVAQYRAATSAGSSVTLQFFGTAARWVGYRGPDLGIANVFVNGVLVDSVDLYAPEAEAQAGLFVVNNLERGPHLLRIQVSGEKNIDSSGFEVRVDAFDVMR